MYFVHGTILGLFWFLAINVALSLAVACVAGRAQRSASWLLALRLLPAALSIAFVAGVFLPSYWRFEPRDFAEDFDLTLTSLAALAGGLLLSALARGGAAWWRAARRAQAWTRTAEPLALEGIDLPAFRIEAPEAVMALVGILRPRLIVTRGLIDTLTPEELAASIEHEVEHYRGWDNLKRLAMRAAPDVLRWTPAASALEQKWAAAAEHIADAGDSISRNRATRLALASALVKVARLMPVTPIIEPVSTLVGGGAIADRVQRLIDDGREPGEQLGRPLKTVCAVAATAGVALVLAVGYTPLLEHVHKFTEILVRTLP
jgi:Zn-dependent protease with chaperone function